MRKRQLKPLFPVFRLDEYSILKYLETLTFYKHILQCSRFKCDNLFGADHIKGRIIIFCPFCGVYVRDERKELSIKIQKFYDKKSDEFPYENELKIHHRRGRLF